MHTTGPASKTNSPTTAGPMTDRRVFWFGAALVLMALSAFLPVLSAEFTNWDDGLLLTKNLLLRDPSWRGPLRLLADLKTDIYMPLVFLSYWVEYRFFGLNPCVYHLTNLVIHLFNCLLVYWFICLLTRKPLIGFLTALFFAIHPLQTASVAWIAQRKTLLCGFFFLGSLIAYEYYLMSGRKRHRTLSFFLFLGSLMSKFQAAALPFLLLLLDLRQARPLDRKLLIEKIPYALSLAFFGSLVFFFQPTALLTPGSPIPGPALALYRWAQASIFYASKFIYPLGLSCAYPALAAPGQTVAIGSWLIIIGGLLLGTGLLIAGRRRQTFLFGTFFCLLTSLPVLHMAIFRGVVADNYAYLLIIGPSLLIAKGLDWTFRLSRDRRDLVLKYTLRIAGGLSLAACLVLTRQRCFVWRDSFSLWNDMLTKHPRIPLGYKCLGDAYAKKGVYSAAIVNYRKALELDPLFKEAAFNLQLARKLYSIENRGRPSHATLQKKAIERRIKNLTTKIAREPGRADHYGARAVAYARSDRLDKALEDFSKESQLSPTVS